MYNKVIDYISGDMHWLKRLIFKWKLMYDTELRELYREYVSVWEIMGEWSEEYDLPSLHIEKKHIRVFRLKYAFLFIIGIIGLGIGLYIGMNSYISAYDYMDYAVEVLYEE